MTKRNIQAARPAAKSKVATKVFAHWPEGYSAYEGVHGPVRDALLVAGLCAAGYAKPLKDGKIGTTGKAGNPKVLTRIVGPGPLSYHTRLKRIANGQLTAVGAEWFTQRNVADELRGNLITAMTKGGEVEGLKFSYEFSA